MSINEIIAEELRSERARLNLSLIDLSKKTGISKDTISKYENSQGIMQLDILEKLINFYGYDFFNFFSKINDRLQNN